MSFIYEKIDKMLKEGKHRECGDLNCTEGPLLDKIERIINEETGRLEARRIAREECGWLWFYFRNSRPLVLYRKVNQRIRHFLYLNCYLRRKWFAWYFEAPMDARNAFAHRVERLTKKEAKEMGRMNWKLGNASFYVHVQAENDWQAVLTDRILDEIEEDKAKEKADHGT